MATDITRVYDGFAPPVFDTHANRLAASPAKHLLWKESDRGFIYLGNGSSWSPWLRTGVVPKLSIETVNNGGIQDDNELLVPVAANERLLVEMNLLITAADLGTDLIAGWSGPSGMTAQWGQDSGTGARWSAVATSAAPSALLALGTSAQLGMLVGTAGLKLTGLFTADASHSGTLTFRWGQNTPAAFDTSVLPGSAMRLTLCS